MEEGVEVEAWSMLQRESGLHGTSTRKYQSFYNWSEHHISDTFIHHTVGWGGGRRRRRKTGSNTGQVSTLRTEVEEVHQNRNNFIKSSGIHRPAHVSIYSTVRTDPWSCRSTAVCVSLVLKAVWISSSWRMTEKILQGIIFSEAAAAQKKQFRKI